MARSSGFLLTVFLAMAAAACFKGAERDKEAPAGNLGGLCLAPDGHCTEGMCNREQNFCFDPTNPCEGFFCGGEERGMCSLDGDLQPACTCFPGYNNQVYSLYCCPDDGISDPNCSGASPSSGGGDGSEEGSSG